MYSALDVAKYIVSYCNSCGYSMSNLKLQKILYFVQAYFLMQPSSTPCFRENIEAWDFGPVVHEVYSEFKQFGSTDIPRVYSDNFENNVIQEKDKKLINDVIEKFKNYSASDLVRITHNQAPWQDAYSRYGNVVIPNSAIRGYFNE